MAFGAVGFRSLAESLFAVMTNPAKLILSMRFLRHLEIFFFHLEDLRVAVRAFQLMLVHVRLRAEKNGSRASFGLKFDITSAHLLGLGIGEVESRKTQDAYADQQSFPNSRSQNFTPLR